MQIAETKAIWNLIQCLHILKEPSIEAFFRFIEKRILLAESENSLIFFGERSMHHFIKMLYKKTFFLYIITLISCQCLTSLSLSCARFPLLVQWKQIADRFRQNEHSQFFSRSLNKNNVQALFLSDKTDSQTTVCFLNVWNFQFSVN